MATKIFKKSPWEVIVIGAGHAGIEAAYAAAKLSCNVLLLTIDIDGIGRLSCNPAVGGVSKGTFKGKSKEVETISKEERSVNVEYDVIARCKHCGKITPHKMYEYYVDEEGTIKVIHWKCLNCGKEDVEEVIVNPNEDDDDF